VVEATQAGAGCNYLGGRGLEQGEYSPVVGNRHDLTSAMDSVTGPSQLAAREALVSGKRCQATVSGKGMGKISRPPRRHHVAVRWRASAREGISGDCVHTFGCWTFRFGSHSPTQSDLHDCSSHHTLYPALPTRITLTCFFFIPPTIPTTFDEVDQRADDLFCLI